MKGSDGSFLNIFSVVARLVQPVVGPIGFLLPWSRVNKTFIMLNSTEHENFSPNKYENANNSWHLHIYWQGIFHAQLCFARKLLQLLVI